MKLANLNRVQGRLATVIAAAAFLLPGCDGGSDETGSGTEAGDGSSDSGSESESESDTTEDTTAETTSAETDTTDPTDSSSTGDTSDDSTTGGPPPEGLGCDMPAACDKGVYEGSPTVTTPADVEELAGYTSITGRLAIANSDVECLTFLSCVETVGHDLNIFNNDLLTDVSGLDNITEIGAVTDGPLMPGGTLTISENDALVDFDSLNLIEQTPFSFSISENSSLETISGFETMVGTRENFEIRFNENLTNIAADGLRGLLFIGGECVVTNNDSLCISTIEQMCGDLKQGPFGGNTANNDEGC